MNSVYTLDNCGELKGTGTLLGVLGDPVAHSLSPVMHNAALAELSMVDKRFESWKYHALHIPANQLASALKYLREIGFIGLNLTIPHKVIAQNLAVGVRKEAQAMGAVNTLIKVEDGYEGTNTDGYGILKAIESTLNRAVADADVWLMGAGGAARGIAVACLTSGCKRLTVVNRSEDRLNSLLAQIGSENPIVRGFSLENNPEDYFSCPILINATSLGLKASDPQPFSVDSLPLDSVVYDTTYGVENALSHSCAEKGLQYAGGLSMLVWQGVRSLEIWTGRKVDPKWMSSAALKELNERKIDAE